MSCLSTKEEFLFSVCKAQTKRKLSKNENAEEVILDRINAPGKKKIQSLFATQQIDNLLTFIYYKNIDERF